MSWIWGEHAGFEEFEGIARAVERAANAASLTKTDFTSETGWDE